MAYELVTRRECKQEEATDEILTALSEALKGGLT
jgi:hypothetical protein